MTIPWFRSRFLLRRRLDRLFLDGPDAVIRRLRGRSHWPPYSLRAFVGGAKDFDQVGEWFCGDLLRLGLLNRGTRILDIGCGCGRVAYTLATDRRVDGLQIRYTGMDIDRASVQWCSQNIATAHPGFSFYHANCESPSYNPGGSEAADRYVFPHPDGSFDLVLLTSVFTHLLEDAAVHYLAEVSRLLAPGWIGVRVLLPVGCRVDGASRYSIPVPARTSCGEPRRLPGQCRRVRREFHPGDGECGRTAASIEPVYYGKQDIVLFRRISGAAPQSADGGSSDCQD